MFFTQFETANSLCLVCMWSVLLSGHEELYYICCTEHTSSSHLTMKFKHLCSRGLLQTDSNMFGTAAY